MRKLLTALFVFGLVGCATSLPRALDDIQTGMDKDRVLDLAGNPSHTYRADQADHWVYTYFVDDHEMKREVVFSEGKVVKISRPLSRDEWTKELEQTSTMEEYEQKVREHQKQNAGGNGNTSGDGK